MDDRDVDLRNRTYARFVELGRAPAAAELGDPEEVAHMTLSLALPAASYVNGAVVVVDGGMTIRHT